ncbi:MAG: DUF86 domain-containing protein [Desulfomonilaceae bacterium]
MRRDYRASIEDIEYCLDRIRTLTIGLTFEEFTQNLMKQEAILRNLEIIGEAVKNIPEVARRKYPNIDWVRIAGLRDIIIHQYFGIDLEIIWDILKTKIPAFDVQVRQIIQEESEEP